LRASARSDARFCTSGDLAELPLSALARKALALARPI